VASVDTAPSAPANEPPVYTKLDPLSRSLYR
jgi:hypothetical protein